MTRRIDVLEELSAHVAAVLCDGDRVIDNSRAVYGVTPDGSAFLWPAEFIEVLILEANGAKLHAGEEGLR